MKKIWIILAIVIIAGGGVYFFNKSKQKESTESPTTSNQTSQTPSSQNSNGAQNTPSNNSASNNQPTPTPQPQTPKTVTVKITAEGFSPSIVSINKGDSVTWINESASPSWPASAMHPTHTGYPGSNITKCGTDEQGTIFDACAGIAVGGQWTFKFTNSGDWKYHDHLNPSKFGTVKVQ
ncbi:MAG: hypothetical protein AAB871_02600 [Patescibacteria group bacterium]